MKYLIQKIASVGQRFHILIASIAITLVFVEWIAICFFGIGGFGIVGYKVQGGWYDFSYFYAAGECWLNKQDPYIFENIVKVFEEKLLPEMPIKLPIYPFFYPPQFAPFCMLFALMDWQHATNFAMLMNFVAAGCLAYLAVNIVINPEVPRPASKMFLTRWMIPCLVMGLPFTIHQAWAGQVTLMAGVFLYGAWYFTRRNQPVLAGILLGMATYKPQYMVLPGLYLILERRWKTLGIASVVSLLLASYPLLVFGPISVIRSWLEALAQYQQVKQNDFGHKAIMGLPSILASLGFQVPGVSLWLLGAAGLVILLWAYRAYFYPDDLLSIVVLIQLCLVYAKYMDVSLLAPVFASIWLHIGHRKKLWIFPSISLLILLVPRQLYSFHLPVMLHIRSFGVLGLLAFILLLQSQKMFTQKLNIGQKL